MACPFTDLRRAPHCARPEPLDSRALIRVHGLDVEVLADELVIVLSVRDRRLEQFAPIARDRPRRKSQDSSRLVNRLAADVVTHQARLARRRADVLGLRPDDRRRQIGIAPAPSPPRCSLRRLLRLGLSGLAPRTPPTPLRSSRSPTLRLLFVLVKLVVLVLGLLVLVVQASDSSSSSSAFGLRRLLISRRRRCLGGLSSGVVIGLAESQPSRSRPRLKPVASFRPQLPNRAPPSPRFQTWARPRSARQDSQTLRTHRLLPVPA